jgi:hypothetical protein
MTPCSFSHLIADKGPKTYIRKKYNNKWCWENWISSCKILKLDPISHPVQKINSKWIKQEALKLQEENRKKHFNM